MACLDCQQRKKNIFQQAVNIAEGFSNAIINTEETQLISKPRLKICYGCPYNIILVRVAEKIASKCEICTCIVEAKTTLLEEKCPKDKW